MKKILTTGFLGLAFAFAMVACNGNKTENTDTTQAPAPTEEQCQEKCMKHCEATCPDSVCLANKCENCACPDDSPCHMKKCCKEGNVEGQCAKEGDGKCCKEGGEGCKKEAENK